MLWSMPPERLFLSDATILLANIIPEKKDTFFSFLESKHLDMDQHCEQIGTCTHSRLKVGGHWSQELDGDNDNELVKRRNLQDSLFQYQFPVWL